MVVGSCIDNPNPKYRPKSCQKPAMTQDCHEFQLTLVNALLLHLPPITDHGAVKSTFAAATESFQKLIIPLDPTLRSGVSPGAAC